MTSHEFAEWVAYSRLEPFGQPRQDYGHALVASVVYNMMKDAKASALQPDDFLPIFNEFDLAEREEQQMEALAAKLEGMFGGRNLS